MKYFTFNNEGLMRSRPAAHRTVDATRLPSNRYSVNKTECVQMHCVKRLSIEYNWVSPTMESTFTSTYKLIVWTYTMRLHELATSIKQKCRSISLGKNQSIQVSMIIKMTSTSEALATSKGLGLGLTLVENNSNISTTNLYSIYLI
jgi:hypothetical protein